MTRKRIWETFQLSHDGAPFSHNQGLDSATEPSGNKDKATDVEDAPEERREMSVDDDDKGAGKALELRPARKSIKWQGSMKLRKAQKPKKR